MDLKHVVNFEGQNNDVGGNWEFVIFTPINALQRKQKNWQLSLWNNGTLFAAYTCLIYSKIFVQYNGTGQTILFCGQNTRI